MDSYEWIAEDLEGHEECKYETNKNSVRKKKLKENSTPMNKNKFGTELDSMQIELNPEDVNKINSVEMIPSYLDVQSQTQIQVYDDEFKRNENNDSYSGNQTQNVQIIKKVSSNNPSLNPSPLFQPCLNPNNLISTLFPIFEDDEFPNETQIILSNVNNHEKAYTNETRRVFANSCISPELDATFKVTNFGKIKEPNLYQMPREILCSIFSFLAHKKTFEMIRVSKWLSKEISYYQEYVIDSISNHPNTIAQFGFNIEREFIYYPKQRICGGWINKLDVDKNPKASYALDAILKASPNLKCIDFQNSDLINDHLAESLIQCVKPKFLSHLTLAKANIMQRTQASLRSPGILQESSLLTLVSNFTALQVLNLENLCNVTDSVIEAAAKNCPQIHSLFLNKCRNITDKSIIALSERTVIATLGIEYCHNITATSIIELSLKCGKHLKEICMTDCYQVNDEAITALARNCQNLKLIGMERLNITEEAMDILVSHQHKNLEILGTENCRHIDWKHVKVTPMEKSLSNLQFFSADFNNFLTDEVLINITKNNKGLRELYVNGCSNISDKSIIEIADHLENLECLGIECCPKLTEKCIFKFASNASLKIKVLGLNGNNQLSDGSICALVSACQNLEGLYLNETAISDTSLFYIALYLKKLAYLGLSGIASITKEGIKSIAEGCQLLRILHVASSPNINEEILTYFKTNTVILPFHST